MNHAHCNEQNMKRKSIQSSFLVINFKGQLTLLTTSNDNMKDKKGGKKQLREKKRAIKRESNQL